MGTVHRIGAATAVCMVALMSAVVVSLPSTPAYAVSVTPIDLGRAAPFAILAGDSVGNTATGPTTIVRGDLGVVAPAGLVTGFPPGEVHGTFYGSGAAAVVNAHDDLVSAYAEAAGRPSDFPLAGDLIGLTLVPGVYTNAGAVANTGTVTLDGGGDANAVFIFQVGGALSMAAAGKVVLTNGTQAKNVFWQVNGAGGIGADAIFAGTLMTSAAISVGANTLFNGRALAKTGAITTNSNQFYSSSPTVSIDPGSTAYSTDTSPTITGTTSVRSPSTVTVTVNGETLTATPASDGTWSATPVALLANATYAISAVVVDGAGNTGRFSQQLTVDTVLPVISIDGGAAITTNDTTPTITGITDVAVGQVVSIAMNRISPPATVNRTALVQADGTWNMTVNGLPSGEWTVIATVTDPAGNHNSATQTLSIDTTPPAATITGGLNALTNDSTPTILGTAEAGSIVIVSVDGVALSGVTRNGVDWSVTYASIPLTLGAHNVAMSATDAAGNAASATQVLTVDTIPPVISVNPGPATADFNSVGPKRVFDTRPGQSPAALRTVAKQQVSGGYELQVRMTDLAGFVPASGVGAVSLNVTSTQSRADGFITVYACGARELVSSVNFAAGRTVANAVVTPISATGTVCFFANTPTDIIVDINGWFATGAAFTTVGPKRVFDTRPGNSPDALRTVTKAKVASNSMIEVRLTDLATYVPVDGVTSVSLNVVVTNPEGSGFVTVYSCGTRALVSSVNYVAGQTVANAVIAPVSATGTVCFYSLAATDLIVDINGWLHAGSAFHGMAPARVLDTRAGNSPDALRDIPKIKIGGGNILEVRVTDLAGRVPANGVTAVSLNVTATNPEADGFITVFACGAIEEVSSLNYEVGATVANAVLAPVSATGTICLYSNAPSDVIVDINGWIGSAQAG
ncbi:MAG TPA: ice-binding family protein [Ilumatobacteraceae bacterium]|nr:ice-binding family protein [Ilumatobacteraceae bacterium]